MRELLERRVLFVGGKGGVGKSTVASALAVRAADAGRRCLLVSMDPAHSLGDLFGCDIDDAGTTLTASLTGMEIDPQATAARHIASVAANVRRFVHPDMYPEVERHLDLACSAPGAMEAALLERMSDLLTGELAGHDLVIFDTAPGGHTLHLLTLPEIMAAWTGGLLANRERSERLSGVLDDLGGTTGARDAGAVDDRYARIRAILQQRQDRFRAARRVISDAGATAFILVLNPERLAIAESRDAVEALRRHNIPVAALVVNRTLPAAADGVFLDQRRHQELEYLARIDREFSAYPRYTLPLQPRDVHGLEGLREIGRLLSGG